MVTEQVDFYLLGRVDNVARLTVACRIANKAWERGMKVYLQTADRSESDQLDRLLWTFSQESFVPHGLREMNSDWRQYPVQIGSESSTAQGIDMLISLQPTVPDDYANYKRIADLIVDDAEQKQFGRERFRHYRQQGLEPKTHTL